MPGNVLGAGDTVVNKVKSYPYGTYILVRLTDLKSK